MSGTITRDGDVYRFNIAYIPAILQELRAFPGRRFIDGHWTVPAVHAAALPAVADRHGLTLDHGMTGLHVCTSTPTVDVLGESLTVTVPYDAETMGELASLPGAQWYQPQTCWLIPRAEAGAVLAFADDHAAEVTEAAEEVFQWHHNRQAAILKATALTTEWTGKPGLGITLFPAQRAAVEYITGHAGGRCIVGDEPGVGKTYEALASLHELSDFPAVVIVPASLKINWMREAGEVLPHKTVEILHGTTPEHRLLWADVTIINYDILPAWLPALPDPKGLVVDEAHYIKNPNTNRARAVFALADRTTGARLALTGTPVLNDTKEFFPLIRTIGRENDFGGEQMAGLYGKNPLHLNAALKATCYVRRRKADAYKDMPGRFWRPLPLEGEAAAMAEYRRAENDIITYLTARARDLMKASGATDEEAKREAWLVGLKAEAARQLVAMNHLRQLSAKAKMPAAMQWAKDFLHSGEKLSVWGWHRAVTEGTVAALGSVKITGGMTEGDRQRSVDLFQRSDLVKSIACQITAAGVGLTLTAGSTALFVEQGWNPGTMDQGLDRHHRVGQTDTVFGHVALIPDTIDEMMFQLIEEKRVEVDAATDGIAAQEEQELSTKAGLLATLTERGLAT
jgi:SWI/SNF-related matrix-associated actin-dependent regulator of chromatin subfamily A-like protein 1